MYPLLLGSPVALAGRTLQDPDSGLAGQQSRVESRPEGQVSRLAALEAGSAESLPLRSHRRGTRAPGPASSTCSGRTLSPGSDWLRVYSRPRPSPRRLVVLVSRARPVRAPAVARAARRVRRQVPPAMILCLPRTEQPRGNQRQRAQGVKMSSSETERVQFLFVKALASWGRLEAVTQEMGNHPQYLASFLKMQHYLLHTDGPLPFDCRHYIALMAAARHQCWYLVNLHRLQFLRVGGDPQWLRGLDFIPPKLRRLSEINKILAHRPWLISKEHVEMLLKTSEQSWSLAELVHAVVLVAHCHALASFVFGCGCEQEWRDCRSLCFCGSADGGSCRGELLRISRKRPLDSCVEPHALQERLSRSRLGIEEQEERRPPQPGREEEPRCWAGGIPGPRRDPAPCCWVLRRSSMNSRLCSNLPSGGAGLFPSECGGEMVQATNLSCYVLDPDFGYQDFATRDEDQTQIFRAQDYSWEDHGFSLVNRLYSDVGYLLDEKFRTADSLQSNALAKRHGRDSSAFKRGVWNYIHCMFGIRYDDYDYAEVNHFLGRTLKVYVKTVTCSPEKTNLERFRRFWKQFKHSEKVHVNLLILEARMQAELLYALRAITQHLIS